MVVGVCSPTISMSIYSEVSTMRVAHTLFFFLCCITLLVTLTFVPGLLVTLFSVARVASVFSRRLLNLNRCLSASSPYTFVSDIYYFTTRNPVL